MKIFENLFVSFRFISIQSQSTEWKKAHSNWVEMCQWIHKCHCHGNVVLLNRELPVNRMPTVSYTLTDKFTHCKWSSAFCLGLSFFFNVFSLFRSYSRSSFYFYFFFHSDSSYHIIIYSSSSSSIDRSIANKSADFHLWITCKSRKMYFFSSALFSQMFDALSFVISPAL